jgi:hypothetical protein
VSQRAPKLILTLESGTAIKEVRSMNPETKRLPMVATFVAISMIVMGCTDAFTVHSIVE